MHASLAFINPLGLFLQVFLIIKLVIDTYLKACQVCKEYVKDSNYETEMEFGQGKRKKRRAAILLHSSDSGSQSDSNSDDKRKNKRMRHKLEKKIPPPPQVLLFDDYVGSPCKESQNSSKYLISKQHPKITQNIVLQENREKDTSSVRESKCKQNKISIKTASDSGLYDKNSELLQKLKSLKEQTSEKKKTIGDKKNCSSYNKDKENQREYSEPNNKQNESALHNVTLCSSSHQSLQEEEKNKVYKLTSQNKKRFPNKSSSIMTNELSSCINTSCINTSVKQISMDEHSSSSIDTTIRCPDSPDTLSSKSSASVRKSNLVQNKDNHRRSLSFSKFFYLLSFSKTIIFIDKSVLFLSAC